MLPKTTPHANYSDDERLLVALKKRIESAVTRLYERGYNHSVPRLFKKGSSWEDAEDAFQDGIIAFLMNIDNVLLYIGLIIQLHTYVRNKWVDAYRKKATERKHLQKHFQEFLAPDPFQDELNEEMQIKLREAINKLTPESQELMNLLLVENMGPKEVAALLGHSVDYVYTQKSRCIKYLRNHLR